MPTAFRFTRYSTRLQILGILALSLSSSVASNALAEEIKVAFIGDQGVAEPAQRVLELIRDEGADLLLIQGDLGYDPDTADQWAENLDSILGEDFPVLIVAGNHENFEWPEYVQWQKDKLERVSDIRCEGDIGVKAYCTYEDIGVVLVSPGITEIDGVNPIDNYADYITDSFSSDDSTWRICSWHKNMRDMQAGGKGDATGWGVYQSCLAQGGLVMTGHEHSYSRTHLMSDFENLNVVHTNDEMQIGPGSSLAIVSGLGGREARPQEHGGDWFASIYTSSQNASFGSLFCAFDGSEADCYFKDIAGLVPDSFSLTSTLTSAADAQAEADLAEQIAQEEAQERAEAEEAEREEAEAAEQAAREEAEAQEQAEREEAEAEERAEAEAAEQAAREEAEAEEQAEAEAAEQAAREEAEAEEQAEAEAAEQAAREEAEAAEQVAREEAEAKEQAEADAAEQAAREDAEAQAEREAAEIEQARLDAEAEATAEQQNTETDSPSNQTTTQADEPAVTADSETPPDSVPTSVADNENTPIVNPAPPPPLSDATTTSGGGLIGWLSILALGLSLTVRRYLPIAKRVNR